MVDMYSGPSTDRSSQNDGLENDLKCFFDFDPKSILAIVHILKFVYRQSRQLKKPILFDL
jgi:hypothetical protein